MKRIRPVLTVGLMLTAVLAGCHSYRAVETPALGSTVRVHIPVPSALADPNAPPASISIQGQVLSSGDTLVLATTTRREYGAFREITQFDTIRLAPDQRVSVELEEFSKGKSIALGAVLFVGAAGLGIAAFGGGGSSPPDGPPGGGPVSAVVSSSVLSMLWGIIRP